jgi:hypothetical protein
MELLPMEKRIFIVFSLTGLFARAMSSSATLSSIATHQSPPTTTSTKMPRRPAMVEQALEANAPLYYFGLGSNMLRSKLENRSSRGKIEVLSFEPAIVHNARLAFNMRGFVPLEPAMGSLEPTTYEEGECPSRPLLAYEKAECHGALVLLTPENYLKVMESEGVSSDNPNNSQTGYEEVVVTAVPYDTSKPPVQAVALRARPESRLLQDPAPSARYMQILRQGAAELGLFKCYQDFLAAHPIQQTPTWIKQVAVNNLIFTFTLNSMIARRRPSGGGRGGGNNNNPMSPRNALSRMQSWILFRLYVPPTRPVALRQLSDLATAAVLLPGATAGAIIRLYRHVTQTEHPPFIRLILGLVHAADHDKPNQHEKKEAEASAA